MLYKWQGLPIGFRISLQIEHFFLRFNLRAQFFFRGQVQLVFAGKKLLIAIQDGVFSNILVRMSRQTVTTHQNPIK